MDQKIPPNNYLRIKVIPKSNQTEFVEALEEEEGITYKVRLKAAPEKGQANKELISFLSKHLAIPKSNISIISGKTDRLKLIKISQ